jgi:predicted helicase
MTIFDILKKYRETSFTQKHKGTEFERLMKAWLQTDQRFAELSQVYLWDEFPSKADLGGSDTGIDLVARTEKGEWWAIQCKCYAEDAVIDKPAVDSFLSTSGRSFLDPETFTKTTFSLRLWISTTTHWNKNAEEAIKGQTIPVQRVSITDLENSPVDWELIEGGKSGKDALLPGKNPYPHQLKVLTKAADYYKTHDRGKLIMACGTGKTYTSLLMMEQELKGKGLVLFMVPSIELLGQTLNAWANDAKKTIRAVCICSDSKAADIRDNDTLGWSISDLPLPASTSAPAISKQLLGYRNHDGLVVVFSTYQSVDAVSEAQKLLLQQTEGQYGVFDFIICDEAHRTTGVRLGTEDDRMFTKIHSDENVQGRKRLYMTGTPKIYKESLRNNAKITEKDFVFCSMDDETIYGEEIDWVNFSYAVNHGLLTDYKVLVLTVSDEDMTESTKEAVKDKTNTSGYNDAAKLIGVINGLSKRIKGDRETILGGDLSKMHRALAFCGRIGAEDQPGTSKNVSIAVSSMADLYRADLPEEERKEVVKISGKHIDGSMGAQQRNEIMSWLKDDTEDGECKVLSNVRCLSEGVDVPALDAVIFLSPRSSRIDIVQSVGRVMRTFHKGQPDEKKYGYIIIPVVVPAGGDPNKVLDNNDNYKIIWDVLNALRSHDDRFQAEIEKIRLNTLNGAEKKNKGKKNKGEGNHIIISSIGGSSTPGSEDTEDTENVRTLQQIIDLNLPFESVEEALYAQVVEKCGDRLYWETWAKEVGNVAISIIQRIKTLVFKEGKFKTEFNEFVKSLRGNLNPSVDEEQAVEMLAQHMITRPVFDALFADYEFVKHNVVSESMQLIVDLLTQEGLTKDLHVLERFYESVKTNVSRIDNLAGKQTVIKNLYEKFFKGAFPKTVDKLGIVYTPVECVDFILNSVDAILKKEFNMSLTDEGVHILDPFTGTGTFITRLLQSGLIKKEDLERKYREEIHCNEIVLLAYYIADVNIESVFHDLTQRKEYLPYEGICLTDTFQLNEEGDNDIFSNLLKENNERVERQKKLKIRVLVGNPPYSVGQKSANDNAQNLSYEHLDARVAETYAAGTKATNKNSLYDSYIKAFRWASDRLNAEEGGIVAFISNGAWIDGNAQDGMRTCIEQEFSSVYVFNLRGNARTSGEQRRKEAGCVFGDGSRTPIAITFLVKNPKTKKAKASIYYHDIGDYLTREQKLRIIRDFKSVEKIEWDTIQPNEKKDWINVRDGVFDSMIAIGDKDNKTNSNTFFYPFYSRGLATARDSWCYSFSLTQLKKQIKHSIDFYNEQMEGFKKEKLNNPSLKVRSYVTYDDTKLSWNRGILNSCEKSQEIAFDEDSLRMASYRPFVMEHCYFNKEMNDMIYQLPRLFPNKGTDNLVICTKGIGDRSFSCLITRFLPDLQLNFNGQCFPLYWYEENKHQEATLFGDGSEDKYLRHDGITDWILKEFRKRFPGSKNLTKEHIFYYVYGILHSPDYRERFAADLKKSLPRIPIVETVNELMDFYNAGKALADLHLNYESVEPRKEVKVVCDQAIDNSNYELFEVEKMRFGKDGKDNDKSVIIYNGHIRLENIPEKAYEYIVNGKSAIEWIMERYAVTIDKDSLIKNDPNGWSREHKKPRYILDLLLSIINLSVKSMEIIEKLPKLSF